jgi:hypothetical protein
LPNLKKKKTHAEAKARGFTKTESSIGFISKNIDSLLNFGAEPY